MRSGDFEVGAEIYPKSTFLSTILSIFPPYCPSSWTLKQEWAEVCPVLVTVPRNGWLAQGHFSPFCQLSQALSILLKFWDLYQGKKLGAWRLGSCQEMAPIQWIRAPDPLLSCLSQKLCSVQCNIDFARHHPSWIYSMCKVNSCTRAALWISVFCVQLSDCDCVQMCPTLHGYLLTSEHSFSWHLHQALHEVQHKTEHTWFEIELTLFLSSEHYLFSTVPSTASMASLPCSVWRSGPSEKVFFLSRVGFE